MSVKQRFVVNEHLDIMLEDDGKTHAYIDGKRFIQCMRLLLNIPKVDDSIEVSSIDDASDKYGSVYEGHGLELAVEGIHVEPEIEFLGHCSNIQVSIIYFSKFF